MIQQINLYQQQDAGEKTVFLNPYVLAVLFAVLALTIVSALSFNRFQSNLSRQTQLQQELQVTQVQLQQLEALYPDQKIDPTLNQEVQLTQMAYQNLSQTLELLGDTQSDQSRGYSQYLLALAAQVESDIWLTGILINSENKSISLLGSTFKPNQIPHFLQRLQLGGAFKGRHFARLSVHQSEEFAGQVNFSVSSSQKQEAEDAADGKH